MSRQVKHVSTQLLCVFRLSKIFINKKYPFFQNHHQTPPQYTYILLNCYWIWEFSETEANKTFTAVQAKMLPLNIGTLSYSTTIFGFRLFKSWEMSPVGKIIHQYIKSNLLLRLLYLKHLNTKKHSMLALKRVR